MKFLAITIARPFFGYACLVAGPPRMRGGLHDNFSAMRSCSWETIRHWCAGSKPGKIEQFIDEGFDKDRREAFPGAGIASCRSRIFCGNRPDAIRTIRRTWTKPVTSGWACSRSRRSSRRPPPRLSLRRLDRLVRARDAGGRAERWGRSLCDSRHPRTRAMPAGTRTSASARRSRTSCRGAPTSTRKGVRCYAVLVLRRRRIATPPRASASGRTPTWRQPRARRPRDGLSLSGNSLPTTLPAAPIGSW